MPESIWCEVSTNRGKREINTERQEEMEVIRELGVEFAEVPRSQATTTA